MGPLFPLHCQGGQERGSHHSASLMRKNCSVLAGTGVENSHRYPPLPRTPTNSPVPNKQSRNRCLQALAAQTKGKLRHVGQGRPLVARPEVTGCPERCWLIPVPRATCGCHGYGRRKQGHVQHSSPLGPGGLCGVMGLCLSTLKLLLNVPWIREILGKSLSEAALSIPLAPNSVV